MRKSQFFIGTIVIIATAMTVITAYMSIPDEVRMRDYQSLLIDLSSVGTARQALSSINDYFINNWFTGYDYRTSFSIDNKYERHGLTISESIDLPDFIHEGSLRLLNSDHETIPFGVEWTSHSSKTGDVYFMINDGPGKSDYYLYYDSAGSPISDNASPAAVTYTEAGSEIRIKTGLYEARLLKTSGGLISDFYVSGSNDLLYSIDSRINCAGIIGLSSAINQEYNITHNGLYVKVTFKGSRFSSESYVIEELFFPDRIIFKDNMRVTQNTACDRWEFLLSANKNPINGYRDANGNNESPVSNKGETLISAGDWMELYDSTNSIGLLLDGFTDYVYVNALENAFEARKIDGSQINQGNYHYNITIVPLHKDSLANPAYREGITVKTSNTSFETDKLRIMNITSLFLGSKGISMDYSDQLTSPVQERTSEWLCNNDYKKSFDLKSSSYLTPFEHELVMPKDFDPNSLRVYDESGLIIHQLSTNNYLNNSLFNAQLNSNAVNNSIMLFNPDGRDFNVTVTKTGGSLTVNAYLPDGSLINAYSITSAQELIQFTNTDQAGFYNLTINGTGIYTLDSTLPKIIATLPAQLNSNERIYFWVNESVDSIILSLATYSSGTHNFSLYNENDELINWTVINNAGSKSFDSTVSKCKQGCYYYLELSSAAPYKIDSSITDSISSDQLFHISINKPSVLITGLVKGHDYFKPVQACFNKSTYVVNPGFSTDLIISTSNYQVNNSYFSFDFDDLNFIVNGVDWFTSGWTTCTTSCTNSFSSIEFLETGPVRAVVLASTSLGVNYLFKIYHNSPVIEVEVNSSIPYSFGPNWAVNGTNDLYYEYSGSGLLLESETDNYVNKLDINGNKAFVTKSDESQSFSIIFNKDDLESNNTLLINDTIIKVNAFKSGEYTLVIDHDPEHYLKEVLGNSNRLVFNYSITSESLTVNEILIS